MKKIFLLFIILVQFSLLAQDKYFIYFKDKGASESSLMKKSSLQYNEAKNLLTERAVERRKKVMGENYITYEDLPVSSHYINQLNKIGIQIIRKLNWFNSVSVYLTADQLTKVRELPFVAKIEPVKVISYKSNESQQLDNHIFKNGNTQSLDYGTSYTQLALSDIPTVHEAGITGEGVLIGFLDSGFGWSQHEALMNTKVLDEYDFINNDTITSNEAGDAPNQDDHGTSVFSTVGAFKEGKLIGAAYNAEFLLAKTEYVPSETKVEEDNYAAALEWMEQKGVDITSSSLGYSTFDPGQPSYTYDDMDGQTAIVTKAAELAFSRGIITITAAGNEGNDPWHFITAPADGFNIIAVGAVNKDNVLASFSSRGPTSDGRIKPEVLAQGVSVVGAVAGSVSNYNSTNGTSLATPLTCGVAALLLSAHPHLANGQVRQILIQTSDNYNNPDNERGYGLISAARAISYPNVEKLSENGPFRLHKVFIPFNAINPESYKLMIAQGDNQYTETALSFDGSVRYSYDFPFGNSEQIKFYFTWKDSSGTDKREPVTGDYYYTIGSSRVVTTVNDDGIPDEYILAQNYPNPFNPSTKITYNLPVASFVKLTIFNLLGEQVAEIVNSFQSAGSHTVTWNGVNLPSGLYVYQLAANGKVLNRKMIMNK